MIALAALETGVGINLETCSVEVREAFLELWAEEHEKAAREAAKQRRKDRAAELNRRLGIK